MAFTLQPGGVGGLAHPFYVGFSFEPKPSPDVPAATLFEMDTRREFAWKDGTWWLLTRPEKTEIEQSTLTALRDLIASMDKLYLGMLRAGTCKEVKP